MVEEVWGATTWVPPTDRHNALIILRYKSWVNFSQLFCSGLLCSLLLLFVDSTLMGQGPSPLGKEPHNAQQTMDLQPQGLRGFG